MKRTCILCFTLLTASIQPAQADIIEWANELYQEYFDSSSSTQPSTAQQNNVNTANRSTLPEQLPASLILRNRQLLQQGKYELLNQQLEQLLQATSKDIANEEKWFTAYKAFEYNGSGYEDLLNTWVNRFPDDYQPYLARGAYYHNLGWESRGHKWSSETDQKQIETMREYFAKAGQDINKALAINVQLLPAYGYLINIAMTTSGKEDFIEYKYLTKAIEANPETYQVRAKYLHSLTPRWGGSHKGMALYLQQDNPGKLKNPELAKLPGLIYLDMANTSRINDAYKAAIETYTKALEFGDNHKVFYERGIAYALLEQYEQALDDYNRAIQLHDEDYNYYYRRASAYIKLNRADEAVSDLQMALLLKPDHENSEERKIQLAKKFSQKAYDLQANGDYESAMKAINQALDLDQTDAYNFNLRGRLRIKFNQFALAEQDIKRAIVLDEKNISHYKLIDWLLIRKQAYDEIIHYWDQYIELVPNNAEAYMERGGTKYHKGDYKAALADTEKAKELGHLDAEAFSQKLKRLLN